MKHHPPVELMTMRETSNPPYYDLYLARYQQLWTLQKLLTVGITIFSDDLSWDKQWYYLASVNNGTFLCKVGQPKLKKISEELLNCRFSPDSRFLLGTTHFRGGMVLFDLKYDTHKVIDRGYAEYTSHASSFPFGWYPDGRAVWYCRPARGGEENDVYFRVVVGSWQSQRLSAREVRQIQMGWDLLDPRFRYPSEPVLTLHRPKTAPKGYYAAEVRYAYSRNCQFRLRVVRYREDLAPEAIPTPEQLPQVKHEVVLESRSGRSQALVSLNDPPWTDAERIIPQAVSNDGQWVLWAAERPLYDPLRREEGFRMLGVLMNVQSGEKQFLPDEIPGIGRYSSARMWFDEG
ncbi:MAG: hypothetical protein WHS44_08015 [Fimbriimonadales bacterium]|nr:MAG: hypothetical protein KatS3mg018_0432 [Fimbriimonadales bacterium]